MTLVGGGGERGACHKQVMVPRFMQRIPSGGVVYVATAISGHDVGLVVLVCYGSLRCFFLSNLLLPLPTQVAFVPGVGRDGCLSGGKIIG